MNLSIAAWLPRARFEFRSASFEILGFVQLLDLASRAQSIFPLRRCARTLGRAALHVWTPRPGQTAPRRVRQDWTPAVYGDDAPCGANEEGSLTSFTAAPS